MPPPWDDRGPGSRRGVLLRSRSMPDQSGVLSIVDQASTSPLAGGGLRFPGEESRGPAEGAAAPGEGLLPSAPRRVADPIGLATLITDDIPLHARKIARDHGCGSVEGAAAPG